MIPPNILIAIAPILIAPATILNANVPALIVPPIMLIVPASKFMMPPPIVITPNVPNVMAPPAPNVIARLAAITIPPMADTLTAPAPVKFKKVAVLKLI